MINYCNIADWCWRLLVGILLQESLVPKWLPTGNWYWQKFNIWSLNDYCAARTNFSAVNKFGLNLWSEVMWLTPEYLFNSCFGMFLHILNMCCVLLEPRASQCVFSWMCHHHSVRALVIVSSRLSLESLTRNAKHFCLHH